VISEWLLSLVRGIWNGIALIVPDVDLSTFDSHLTTLSGLIGSGIGQFDGVFPITETMVFITWTMYTWLPAYLTFLITRWVYARVPVIGS